VAHQRLPADQVDRHFDLTAENAFLLDLLRRIIHEGATTSMWSMRAGCVKDVFVLLSSAR
jgi:hypothetical protein